jgi:hypothetical protein
LVKNRLKIGKQITKVFKELVDEYLDKNQHDNDPDEQPIKTKSPNNTFDNAKEHALIKDFLASPCSCFKPAKTI